MNFQAGSASASALPGHWHSILRLSCAMNRFPRWTFRSRRRSSTCSRICRRNSNSPIFSSLTTSRWWSISPTMWVSCTWVTWWSMGPRTDIFRNPMHPYTQALLSAAPIPDPAAKMNRIILEGSIPSPANPPPAASSTRAAGMLWKSAKQWFQKPRKLNRVTW